MKSTKNRNRNAGLGVGAAAATVGAAIAQSQGVELDQTTVAAAGSLFTAFFGWIGGLFGRD